MVERLIYWTGAVVLLLGGWALAALLLWQAIELTLTLFRVKRLVLEFYWDRLKQRRARVTTTKRPSGDARA
jgi:hypothetical protein